MTKPIEQRMKIEARHLVGWLVGCLSVLMMGQSAAIRVGDPFPGLVLPRASDGAPDSILAYRGQKTVVHVFASW